MVETNDGFVIAETDLKLRGPGDIAGTMQSGALNFRIADLSKDGAILEKSRIAAMEILEKDPKLILPENQLIISALAEIEKETTNYSRIS